MRNVYILHHKIKKNQSKSHKFTQKYQKNQKQKRVGMKLGHDLIIHLQDNILGRNTT